MVIGSVVTAGNSINMDDRNFILHDSGQFHCGSALRGCIILEINKSLICAGKYALPFMRFGGKSELECASQLCCNETTA